MICLVTDRRRLSAGPEGLDRLVDLAAAAVAAGIDIVHVRERDLDARPLAALVSRIVAAAEGSRTKVLVNDRADVAVAAGAHGVHLRGDSITAPAVRSLLGRDAIVGRSVHNAVEAAEVSHAGAVDYLVFGTLYRTLSKDDGHPEASLDDLSAVCKAAQATPVLAIGGITVQRAGDVARAGAAGVAGIGLFVPPAGIPVDRHLETVAHALRHAFDSCGVVS
jgi:thiamine-phosphate pyrophosphorylase